MAFIMLKDADNNLISYKNAPMQADVIVMQNGRELFSRKMNFSNSDVGKPSLRRGLFIPFSSISNSKVTEGGTVDVEIAVKTPNTYLRDNASSVNFTDYASFIERKYKDQEAIDKDKELSVQVVNQFLTHLSNRELKKAYNLSVNDKWKDYNTFSSPRYGFGSVQNVNINSIKLKNYEANKDKAIVVADYTIKDSLQGQLYLQQQVLLQKIGDVWRIVSTKNIN